MMNEPRNSSLDSLTAAGASGGALDDEELIDVYAAGTSLEADRIVLILKDDGIEGLAHATTVPAFPSSSEQHYLVLVPAHAQERARVLISEAVRDGVLSEKGAVL